MKWLIYLKNWLSLDLLVSPLCLRYTSIVTSRHSFMIAVTVRVNNHWPAFLWWRFTVGCRIIVYILNGAVPSNVKVMSWKLCKAKGQFLSRDRFIHLFSGKDWRRRRFDIRTYGYIFKIIIEFVFFIHFDFLLVGFLNKYLKLVR